MVSKCMNRTLFLCRDGVRLHRMKFYIYECSERNDLKSMIQERCGVVVETKGEHVVCFATQCPDLDDGEIFSTEYIKQCCENNMLLDLKKFRLGKNPGCSNVDPLEVLKGLASWPNIRCFINSSENNSVNELKETQDSELSPQKRRLSTRKKNGMEQEGRVHHWRQAYSREEDMTIIRYLLKNNNYKKAGTNTLWKNMELQEVLRDRSWQSMKNRLRIIRLHPEKYDLSDEDVKKLGGKTAARSSNSLKVSDDKGRCCFCCPKMDQDRCEVANESDDVRYTCQCSQHIKKQAETSVKNEALLPVESIGRKFCYSLQSQAKQSKESRVRKRKPLREKQCDTNRAESLMFASSRPSGDETAIESEPKRCFLDTSTPFHKTHRKVTVKNGAQPNHKRRLYTLPSSDINISIKSGDISLIKNNGVHKKISIPLRWPQIFTPFNSAVFEEQVTESDTVAPEALNHKKQNQDRCPDENGSTVYGSCQSSGKENGSATHSNKSSLSGEEIEAPIAVDHLTIVKRKCLSSKTEETLPDKGQKSLNMRSHSTPKKVFQIFNKTDSRNFVNYRVCNSECSKAKSVINRMEIEEGIISPSFSTNSTSSGFHLQKRMDKSVHHVNECINGQMSPECRKLQTSKSNKVQHESQFEITNILYTNSIQDEESPVSQHNTAQDVRPVPEKDSPSSPTLHQEHSNSRQQSSRGSLPGEDFVVDGDKHCQHISNYKYFYVKQWLNSVMHYYENDNLSKLPSFSEKLKEMTTSSEQDDNHKNISCDNLNEDRSCAATETDKNSHVQIAISTIDKKLITESCYGAKSSNSVVNNEHISPDSCKISVLKEKSACVTDSSERLDNRELPQSSSLEDSSKKTPTVPNVTEPPDRNVVRESISGPSIQPTAGGSEGDYACHLQSYAEKISSVNTENGRTEPFLQISHVTSLHCEHTQVRCCEESCDSSDILMESQFSQDSNHIPIPTKKEISISVADDDDDDSFSESQPSQVSDDMPIRIKQEISISIEDEEFRYEGCSPPVDFLTHVR